MKYWVILVSISGIAIIIAILYLCIFLRKHARFRNDLLDECEEYRDTVSSAYLYIIRIIAEKRYDAIRTYHITQLSNKLSGIMSVTYSILGLLSFSSLFENEKGAQIITSLLSILFVISALYISPASKAEQYWIAWQEYDSFVRKMILEIMGNDKLKEKATQCSTKIGTIENSLSSDLL